MPDNPQFGTAQYAPPPPPPSAPAPGADGAFPRALLLGLIGAAIGCCLYAGFVILTKIEIGYMSLAVGFIIAKAMMMGSKGIGGRQYQITAALLTYAAVSLSIIPIIRFQFPEVFTIMPIGDLIQTGLTAPFQELKADTFRGVIGLVILFVGMNIAWKMTAGKPRAAA
ncbi:MAG TPA: hypothetical protein VI685_01670 [Candidatus Angelobacter sp.]